MPIKGDVSVTTEGIKRQSRQAPGRLTALYSSIPAGPGGGRPQKCRTQRPSGHGTSGLASQIVGAASVDVIIVAGCNGGQVHVERFQLRFGPSGFRLFHNLFTFVVRSSSLSLIHFIAQFANAQNCKGNSKGSPGGALSDRCPVRTCRDCAAYSTSIPAGLFPSFAVWKQRPPRRSDEPVSLSDTYS